MVVIEHIEDFYSDSPFFGRILLTVFVHVCILHFEDLEALGILTPNWIIKFHIVAQVVSVFLGLNLVISDDIYQAELGRFLEIILVKRVKCLLCVDVQF